MPILISTRPRSTIVRTGGGTFGCPANGPPRHVRSWKPSATDGRVPKNMSSSRRMYSRSCGVKGQGAGVMRPVMTAIVRRSHCRPNGDQTSREGSRDCGTKVSGGPAGKGGRDHTADDAGDWHGAAVKLQAISRDGKQHKPAPPCGREGPSCSAKVGIAPDIIINNWIVG